MKIGTNWILTFWPFGNGGNGMAFVWGVRISSPQWTTRLWLDFSGRAGRKNKNSSGLGGKVKCRFYQRSSVSRGFVFSSLICWAQPSLSLFSWSSFQNVTRKWFVIVSVPTDFSRPFPRFWTLQKTMVIKHIRQIQVFRFLDFEYYYFKKHETQIVIVIIKLKIK